MLKKMISLVGEDDMGAEIRISCLREREKVSDAYRLLLESKDLLFSMMIMLDSFSKIFFFLSSLKLNQSARLTQRLEHRPFVVRKKPDMKKMCWCR
ncbi:hypothetical protein YC2023_052488 [Brassica napus]